MFHYEKNPPRRIQTLQVENLPDIDKCVFKNNSTTVVNATLIPGARHMYKAHIGAGGQIDFTIAKATDGTLRFQFQGDDLKTIQLASVSWWDYFDMPSSGSNQLRYSSKFFKASAPLADFDTNTIVPRYEDQDGIAGGPDNTYFTQTFENNTLTIALYDPV